MEEHRGGTGPDEQPTEEARRDPLKDLEARIDAAIAEARPKVKRALEELDARLDSAVEELRPRIDNAVEDVKPRVNQLLKDMQPRLDSALERIQAKIAEFRQDLEERTRPTDTPKTALPKREEADARDDQTAGDASAGQNGPADTEQQG